MNKITDGEGEDDSTRRRSWQELVRRAAENETLGHANIGATGANMGLILRADRAVCIVHWEHPQPIRGGRAHFLSLGHTRFRNRRPGRQSELGEPPLAVRQERPNHQRE